MQRLLEPRPLLAMSAVFTVLFAVLGFAIGQSSLHGLSPARFFPGPLLILVPNVLALYLAWKIAQDHKDASAMGLCWRLIMAGHGVNALRNLYEFISFLSGRVDPALSPELGLRQILIALSLVLLGGALAGMWSSFTSLGLGVRLRVRDVLLMVAILLLVPPVFAGRELMLDAPSPYAFVRYLQYASPFLLAVPASLGVVLYRISAEMGGGALATALRLFVLSFALRLVALVTVTNPWVPDNSSLALGTQVLFNTLAFSAHWIFLLGLSYRWQVSRRAANLITRYETHAHEELAALAGSIARHQTE